MQERCFTEAFRTQHRHVIAFLLLFLFSIGNNKAQASTDTTLKCTTNFPYFGENKKLSNDFYFSAAQSLPGQLAFSCFRFAGNDSLLVYSKKGVPIIIKAGVTTQIIRFGQNDANSYVHPAFFNIIRKCGTVPAGSYKVYVAFKSDSGFVYQHAFLLNADSTLPPTSSLSKGIDGKLAPENKKGFLSSAATTVRSSIPASKALESHSAGINRLFKSSGLTPQIEQRSGKSIVNLWYEDWFVGRYELDANTSAASQIEAKKKQVSNNISSTASTELQSYRSLFSQVRELTKSEKEDRELTGELAVSGNWSNGQPEYSAQNNNFYEVRGRVETEVADIPVSLEGYYTTQDAHRLIKGSYIRVHYNADRAKARLMKLISGYRRQFNQTVAKGQGLEQVYGSYLNSLQSSKEGMINDIKRQAGLSTTSGAGIDTSKLKAQLESALEKRMQEAEKKTTDSSGSRLDSAGKVRRAAERTAKVKDSVSKLYATALNKYQQVQKTEAQIEKYSRLLEQYKNTNYFDSALAYSKMTNLKSGDETTYKQMAKSAAGLLPEGKAKTFIAGLTNLDAGIINKYTSKYTAAGQQLKGLDLGYDIGFAQVGFTVGKTEYAGRDGSLDKYTTYSGRVQFTPAKGQKATLIYYGYTPSKSMLSGDDFFKNADIALPTFKAPVHIISATYEGIIAKIVSVEAEAATSYRNGSGQSFKSSFDADRTAWHINAEGQVPRTPFSLIGSYEHGGNEFQNSTLPVMISGSDLYKAGVKGTFFHNFLSAGIEFNHMEQQNLYSKGGNNRWGFEVATHSKQYPSLSLSYKPFATFRAATDTLAVPQRPLQGAVWIGKASYQIKKKGGVSYRFSAVLNRSTSHTDSVSYSADLLQLNAMYTDKRWMVMVSGGQSNLATNSSGAPDTLNPAHVRTTFLMGSAGYNFSKSVCVTGGADVGIAPFGISKYGVNGGLSYGMKRAPLTTRVAGRYGGYRLAGYSGAIGIDGGSKSEPMSWRKLLGGSVELIWQFRMKLKE